MQSSRIVKENLSKGKTFAFSGPLSNERGGTGPADWTMSFLPLLHPSMWWGGGCRVGQSEISDRFNRLLLERVVDVTAPKRGRCKAALSAGTATSTMATAGRACLSQSMAGTVKKTKSAVGPDGNTCSEKS